MIDDPNFPAVPAPREHQALEQLVDLLRGARWRIQREGGAAGPHLLLSRGKHRYAVALKVAVESRRDRLVPLFAAAILESQAFARMSSGSRPLAVVMAPRLPDRVVHELLDYADRMAPGVAIGIIDLEGRVEMRGPGLDGLRSIPSRPPSLKVPAPSHQPFDMFSDLNQWMLKVLLAPRVPAPLLNGPRSMVSSAAELARIAQVSAPSAFRLVRHLKEGRWLDEVAPLRLVRIQELLRRWKIAYARPQREIRTRWLIPGRPEQQLRQALRRYNSDSPLHRAQPRDGRSPVAARTRVCLGLFSAAEALGVGHVHGAPQHVYVERPDPLVFDTLGLSVAQPGDPVHVVVRIPRWPRSLFRGAVDREGVLVSDVLQVWLDVSEHPARGDEQAEEIWKRVLGPVVDEGSMA